MWILRERRPCLGVESRQKDAGANALSGTIVEPELFDKVQDLIRNKPHWNNAQKFEYPLSGAIKCAGCGCISWACNRRYYACTVCHFMINAALLERWFRGSISKNFRRGLSS